MNSSLAGFLEAAANRYGDRPVMTSDGTETSYARLMERSERFAAALAEDGVSKGDRVALMLPNCPEYVVSFFAVVRIGAVVTQVNPMYVGRELDRILGDSGAKTIVVHKDVYPKLKAVRGETRIERVIVVGEDVALGRPDTYFDRFLNFTSVAAPVVEIDPAEDLAVLQYTGGTTGLAKAAMLTHQNLLSYIGQHMDLLLQNPQDLQGGKSVAVAPFFHVFGTTVVMLTSIEFGMNMQIVPRFRARELAELIGRERTVMLGGVATLFTALHNRPDLEIYGLGEVLLYLSGGASVPVGLHESFRRRTGRPIYEGYGLSEGAPVAVNPYLRGPVPGSIGVPMPGTEMKIVDLAAGEQDLPVGESGELVVKGPQVMKGYWNMPEETADAVKDGWLHTGDIARMDEDGYFYVVDRKKDVIIASGYNVYPREVEEVLYEHPEVVEAVAVGVPDEYRGETVKAFVVKRPGATLTEEELIAHCKARLAAYKAPKSVVFRSELPKSGVGKLLRRKLIEEEQKQSGARK